ncbi:hypothetical protein AVEN_137750-1 [Araneus ventricosus]|uniref:Uncharacterized protein n=1 Tax=Araneus ventricosus TaxID=182803 RepID=A0A4Y2NY95_ARAVE|nr:hypothetical protein AVEN_137750-1 [Araneus ventricosus]
MLLDATDSHAFSISLIALEDCCFAVISSLSVKLSSATACCATSQALWSALGRAVPQAHRYHCCPPPVPRSRPKTQSRCLQAPQVLSQTSQCRIREHSKAKASPMQKWGFSLVLFLSLPFPCIFDNFEAVGS